LLSGKPKSRLVVERSGVEEQWVLGIAVGEISIDNSRIKLG
jgi:hypothetical protein